jgi:UDP-2-acetamido-3-amino-2,3-dideoxy-glucuronate N-acetyltransferase
VSYPSTFIHPSAVVDEGVVLGQGTRVWHFCHVSKGARIGRDVSLGQNVYVAPGAVLGDRVKVQNNVSLYAGVLIDDDVFLGPSCVFTNVSHPRSAVSRRDAFETTRVGRGATIGANATVVCGRTIGAYAFIAAGAVVTKDVKPHALMMGVPALQHGWACVCGETLPDEPAPQCARCEARYDLSPAGTLHLKE